MRFNTRMNKKPNTNEGWLKSVASVANYAGVSPRLVQQWIFDGYLTPTRLSKRLLLFKPEHVDAAIENMAAAFEEGN